MSQKFGNWRKFAREGSAALALVMLLVVVGLVAPSFFTVANLRDLVLGNLPVFIVAAGMTILIIAGHIDISVGAQFACASVAAGWLAKSGLPVWLLIPVIGVFGSLIGALNGLLVARFNMPSIVVTLAMMVALRDSLRWITAGEWVQGLPRNFQWFGLGQTAGEWMIMLTAAAICGFFIWSLGNLSSGRAIYAVGSDREAARLAGIAPVRVIFFSFTLMGLLTGIAALLNSIRFAEVQGNAGVGLELKAIAAVVVGGTAIRGGRGTIAGTVLGVALLGTISTALTFVGVSAFWEKAVQGAIILAAVASDVLFTGKFRVKALQTEQAKA